MTFNSNLSIKKKNGKPSLLPPNDMQPTTATEPPPAAQVSAEQWKQAHCNTLLVGSSKAKSAYYHRDGHPWESKPELWTMTSLFKQMSTRGFNI
jgi:hypothetical protein